MKRLLPLRSSILVSTPGTDSTTPAILFSVSVCSRYNASRSIVSHFSRAAIQPIISSFPTFIARHTAPSTGVAFASAASIRSCRPSKSPLACGPRNPLPPLNPYRSTPIRAYRRILSTGGMPPAASTNTGIPADLQIDTISARGGGSTGSGSAEYPVQSMAVLSLMEQRNVSSDLTTTGFPPTSRNALSKILRPPHMMT